MDDDMSTPTTAAEPKPGRRRLLKALAGAGGVFATGALLPERWTRPVVESIIVPAHAQATGVLARSYAGSNFVSPGGSVLASRGLGQRILNTVIPAANAGEPNGIFVNPVSVCLQPGAGTVAIQIYDCIVGTATGNAPLNANGSFSGSVNIWGVSGQLDPAGGTVDLNGGGNVGSYGIWVLADAPCTLPVCNVTSFTTEIFVDNSTA